MLLSYGMYPHPISCSLLTRRHGSLGYFDPAESQPFRQLGWSDVNLPPAQDLAHKSAVEGIVLLKNDGTLPFKRSVKKIALIGPWANATKALQGNYQGVAPFLISPVAGAQAAGFDVTFSLGTQMNTEDTSGFADAMTAASSADAIVFAGGIDLTIEKESLDRTQISWPGNQLDLITQLESLHKPLVVVQFGGGQVDHSALKTSKSVRTLLPERNSTVCLMFDRRSARSFGPDTPVRVEEQHFLTFYLEKPPQLDGSLSPNTQPTTSTKSR